MRPNPRYTFDDFVIEPGNTFAHAGSFAVAEAPGKAYNPLYVYGSPGAGKTHLLHAIGNHTAMLYPHLNCCYVAGEQLGDGGIDAIFKRSQEPTRFSDVDLLLVDDLQSIERDERTQRALFQIFTALHRTGKQIAIASRPSHRQITLVGDQLRTWLQEGLIVEAQPSSVPKNAL